ncbi:MAG TPA: aldehyde dehydrogenase family protein [Chitinophagales bacterium]|nr:aldehyde dehydrogenase family protein [Chitinophagales bacterium]
METFVTSKPAGRMQLSANTPSGEIQRLYNLQQQNKQNVKKTTAKERKRKLNALKKKIFEHREAIRQALFHDFRKAPAETDITEIYPSVSEIRHAVDRLEEWMHPLTVETPISFFGTSAKVIYEPKGCTLIISPWNYPFQLCIIPLVSAVAAGNCSIIKPSEYTPHTAAILKSVLKEVFNENEVAVVEGDYTVSQELLRLKFDHIFFTGSPAVGKIVMKAAAEHLTSVTLELGGKSPVIVDETANVKASARRIAWGKLLNNGQTCIAPDYLFVHESRYSEFIDELKKSVANEYGRTEEEIKRSPDYCRIINSRHHARVKKLIEDAVEKGATVVMGGKIDDADNYISPTVLTDVPKDAEVLHEEIFGPVLPVLTYRDIKEPLDYINSKEKPLALYVFSKSRKNIDTVLSNTSAGGTCINETLLHNAQPNLPFGGVNNSGIGNSHGYYGFKAFSHERAILKQHLPKGSMENMYPPYKGFVLKMIDFTLKYF